MTDSQTVVVLGGTGFVGSAIVRALRARGIFVRTMRAPRLASCLASEARAALAGFDGVIDDLAREIAGATAVVNAAGNPDASLRDEGALISANALVPAVVALAVVAAGVPRFVHVSSAAVQGARPRLDETTQTESFSAYSRSKELGEVLVRENGGAAAIIFRPPSVHAADRRVSQMTARIARSPWSSVAHPGSSPSPQALLTNVADATAFLATTTQRPPAVVIHPSEGLTTESLLTMLGGHPPRLIPRQVARLIVIALILAGRTVPSIAANARRVQMIWFGQAQAPSWLTGAGWRPPAGIDAWKDLGTRLGRIPSTQA